MEFPLLSCSYIALFQTTRLWAIIVTAFKTKGSTPFLRILLGPMISTHSLYHVISSASLAGNWPYVFIGRFVRRHTSHSVTYFRMAFLMSGQYKCCEIIASVLFHTGLRRYLWYHFTIYCWSFCGMTILFLYVISFTVFWPPQKEPL